MSGIELARITLLLINASNNIRYLTNNIQDLSNNLTEINNLLEDIYTTLDYDDSKFDEYITELNNIANIIE